MPIYNIDRWVRAAANGQISGVVLIDLSAAFDLVDHQLLVNKLKIYGVQQDLIKWISSYLGDRRQAVWIDHCLSEFLDCDVGVPQGSILGPLLFLIFFNDLPACIKSPVDTYADDTTVTAAGKHIEDIEQQLSVDCDRLSKWMKSNRLKLNQEKTHVMRIGTRRRLARTRQLKVTMDDATLQQENSEVELLLGCQVQSDMKWNKQVASLKAKLMKRLNCLSHLRHGCPYHLRKTFAEGIFNSCLNYCLPLFGGLDKGQIKGVQILQNKAARMVCGAPPRSERTSLYDQLGWLTFNQLIVYNTLIMVKSVRDSKEPEYLSHILSRDSRNGRIMLQGWMLGATTQSFCFRGASGWNLLPREIRNENSMGIYKKRLKQWVLDNVPRFLD